MGTEKQLLILKRAGEVFQAQGYKRVNMKEIARSLNISRPGLYLYFKTKEEIFCAVVRRFGDFSIERAAQAAAAKSGLEEKLHAAFEAYVVKIFSLSQTSPEAKEIAESSFLFAKEAVEESYRQFENLIASILRQYRSSYQFNRHVSIEQCAHLLVSAARGFKLIAERPTDLRKMIHQLLQMTLQL